MCRTIIPLFTWHIFWINIQTLKHLVAGMVVSLSNEVAMILSCPGGRAVIFSWEHQVERPCRHLAYCTRCIVAVMVNNVCVFCPINLSIVRWLICSRVLWIIRQTQVVCSSTWFTITASSNSSSVDECGASNVGTGGPPPSCVDNTTPTGSRGSNISLGSLRASVSLLSIPTNWASQEL